MNGWENPKQQSFGGGEGGIQTNDGYKVRGEWKGICIEQRQIGR